MRGLKKFKRLAKQDLLFSMQTSEPLYWYNHAVARREQYTQFMEAVERGGVDEAYRKAVESYTQLPRLDCETAAQNPEIAGREQAFHLFFDLLGIDQKTIAILRNKRKRPLRKRPNAAQSTHKENALDGSGVRYAQRTS